MKHEFTHVLNLYHELQPLSATPIVVGEIGADIGTHAGRGTIGVVFRTP
jgi:hypothetical protein